MSACYGGVAADFDNDMDLDLYLACRQGAENLENRYYDNDGDGTFTLVSSHGAEGPVGTGIELGVADSVVTADYDVDGFMDLAVANGLLFYPVSRGGPDTLLRNTGNSNHWIEIDLNGSSSNRQGVGAKVFATAGGVTQVREQNGGYHWTQSTQITHFEHLKPHLTPFWGCSEEACCCSGIRRPPRAASEQERAPVELEG